MTCQIAGTLVVSEAHDQGGKLYYVWDQADPQIHVSCELLDNITDEGRLFLTDHYELGEWCPHDPFTRHARRKDTL